jgi:hypothetical protein
MSWRRQWLVLVPGDVAWVEQRTREILEEEGHGSEDHFRVIPGQGRYQVIAEKGREEIGSEFLLGEILSLECEGPVYAIEGNDDVPYISRFMKGEESREDRAVWDLVSSLGCVLPWLDEPPLEPVKRRTRTVVLIKGSGKAQVLRALEKKAGKSLPPNCYRLEEMPQGVLLRDGVLSLGSLDMAIAEQLPRALVYSVIARRGLEDFVVYVMRGRKIEQFALPPDDPPLFPVIHEVMGESEPELILEALGIPVEWFQP